MIRLLARLVLLLPSLIAALLLLMHLPTYNAAAIARFFDACTPLPCWQGIRPGETTLNGALAILRAHPWIATVSQVNPVPFEGSTAPVLIYWTWSRDYPYSTDVAYSEQGIIIAERGLVRQLFLTTSIPFGDLWLALGGTLDYQYDATDGRVNNTAVYADEGITATAMFLTDCQMDYADLWHTPVYMWLRDSAATAAGERPTLSPLALSGYRRLRAALC